MYLQPQTAASINNNMAKANAALKSIQLAKKKKKTFLKITYVKVKVFIWNLSPLHWYDDMKDIKIDLDQFECKKIKK